MIKPRTKSIIPKNILVSLLCIVTCFFFFLLDIVVYHKILMDLFQRLIPRK